MTFSWLCAPGRAMRDVRDDLFRRPVAEDDPAVVEERAAGGPPLPAEGVDPGRGFRRQAPDAGVVAVEDRAAPSGPCRRMSFFLAAK